MIIFEKDCFAAYVTIDDQRSALFGYFSNFDDAIEASKGKGWYNSDGRVEPYKIKIVVYESMLDFEEILKRHKKEAALNKLTDEERKLLGL